MMVASFTACVRAEDSKPRLAPPPRAQVAPAVAHVSDAPITLALDAPAPSTLAGPSTGRVGVLWRAKIAGADPESIAGALVIGGEVFVSTPRQIQVFDLATGAKLRIATLAHGRLVATHDALVMTTDREEVGLDKQTLRPTWHAPAPNFLAALGDYVLETPLLSEPQVLRLRRASDGHVVWQIHEQLFASGTTAVIDGDALYVRAYVGAEAAHVTAIDVATGALRWRTEGYLASASGGHVVIQDPHAPPPSYRILDAAGHVRWRSSGAWLWVQGDVAYASTPSSITALELATNRVRWRRTNASALESDDRWLYALCANVA